MDSFQIDRKYLLGTLKELLEIPSPTGFTDNIVRYVCKKLGELEIDYDITRRGAIRANLPGKIKNPDRAIVTHLDTIGCMVRELKENGRLGIMPIGHWSSRFAEGARVTIFSDDSRTCRGTILPLKASGHTFGGEIDEQPISWEQAEIRVDEIIRSKEDLERLEIHVGDYVAIDPQVEVLPNGYIVSRHLDDKAGVATVLATARAVREMAVRQSVECHLLFTISEEMGSGASAILHQDVAEMVTVDNATPAKGQNSKEFGVTIAMMDSSGPFDYHLSHKLLDICHQHKIEHQRDLFRYYRCDSASAVEAGNDIRTALVSFGVDSSHGYERTNIEALVPLAKLLVHYIQSPPAIPRDKKELGSLEGFPVQ
ncbi:MAG: osmoprotectant NAGGN system M42 family peptidase [Desulfobulbaceae bacterium]|nr:osmoprotectant NAGGN system M42 family peptidase [Desulfobulbaceae bacterium]